MTKAEEIVNAFMSEQRDYDRYNVFLFWDGRIEFEPVTGSYGAGYPADESQYRDFLLNAEAGWLEDPDRLEELYADNDWEAT